MSKITHKERDLEGFSNESGFIVPDGYFDHLAYKIQDACVQETKQPEKVGLIQVLKPQLAFISLIAVFAIMVYSVYTFVIPQDTIKRGLSAIELDISDFEYFDIEEEIIVDAIINQIDTVQKEEPSQEISDELLHYLIENNVDFTTLLEDY